MDAAGRKAFWDTLCSLNSYDHESMQKLIKASPCHQELCRFRAVNESSLLQLQDNKQFFSTANYYDDPFDTHFYINFALIQELYDAAMDLNNGGNDGVLKDLLGQLGLKEDADTIIQNLKVTPLDINNFSVSLKNTREMIKRQIYSICFCENPLSETMWLKYADHHKGFAQVYDFNDPNTRLFDSETNCVNCGVRNHPPMIFPIYYSDTACDATMYALTILFRDVFKDISLQSSQLAFNLYYYATLWQPEKVSLIKRKCHQYDQEWRMLLSTPYSNRPYIRLKPKNILIGLRTPEYQRQQILSAARIAGIEEIHQVVINDNNQLEKRQLA